MPQTMRQWLEARAANQQDVVFSLANPNGITESAHHLLTRILAGPYARELDALVEAVDAPELWSAYGKVAHIARTAHLAFAYAADVGLEKGES